MRAIGERKFVKTSSLAGGGKRKMIKNYYYPTMLVFLMLVSACNSLVVDGTVQTPIPQNNDEEFQPAQIIDLDEDRTSMRILWIVADYVLGSQFDGDEAEARKMFFTPLDMTETQIIFQNQMCDDVIFAEESVVLSEYLAGTWQETPQSLGIESEQEVSLIRTNCELFGFREYLRLSDARLLVPYNNVFYFFNPYVDY